MELERERRSDVIDQSVSVLIISHDVVGPRMAGPGIRYWELAKVLAQHFQVTLAVPGETSLSTIDVQLWPYDFHRWESLALAVERADAILLCGDMLAWFPALEEAEVPLVVDGYDPHPLETLELFTGAPEQDEKHRERERILHMQCRAGDFFVCASERQRDWWLGLLEATGRINVHTYGEDPSLRRLVDIVPFGLPSSPPRHTQQTLAFKGVWPGISPADKVVLWGGGLWQWLDPLSAVRAMARIQEQRDDVKLVFPGTRHPNMEAIPDMPMHQATLRLAEELDVLNRCVFFGDWVDYDEWPNYLTESDVGLSLHFDTVETRLAFRSRVLDYIWAGLPMIATRGDATSEIVSRFGLGKVIDYERDDDLTAALLCLLEKPKSDYAAHFERARAELTWEQAAEPLVTFCQHPRRAPDKVDGLRPPPAAWEWWELACSQSVEIDALRAARAQQDAETARLRALVAGYEKGRFIRLMTWLHNLRRRGK
jgi:glycosyltransferase involved in cell wall biosynthesis